jgi:hypothetical protein
LVKKKGMGMGPSICQHNDLLLRYLMLFLIGYVLFAIHAGADTHKTNMTGHVPQIGPGKASGRSDVAAATMTAHVVRPQGRGG